MHVNITFQNVPHFKCAAALHSLRILKEEVQLITALVYLFMHNRYSQNWNAMLEFLLKEDW